MPPKRSSSRANKGESDASANAHIANAGVAAAAAPPGKPVKMKGFFTQIETETHACKVALSLPTNLGQHPHVLHTLQRALGENFTSNASQSFQGGSMMSLGFSNFSANNQQGASFMGARGGDGVGVPLSDNASDVITTQGTEWSLLEDKLLLHLSDTRSDLLNGYRHHHRLDPAHFPKALNDDGVLRARVTTLEQTAPERLRLLKALPDDEVGIFAEELRQEAVSKGIISPPDDSIAAETISQFSSTVFDATGRSQAASGGLGHTVSFSTMGSPRMSDAKRGSLPSKTSFHRRRSRINSVTTQIANNNAKGAGSALDDLVIRCKSRHDLAETEILCSSKTVLPHSPFIADMFHRSTDAGLKHITLDETDPMWSGIAEMHDVYGADNLLRFKQFCDAPKIWDQLRASEAKADEARKLQDDEWNAFVERTSVCRKAHLDQIKRRQKLHEKAVKDTMNASLEKDIAALRAIYDAHTERELRDVAAAAAAEKSRVETFFDSEVRTLQGLAHAFVHPEAQSALEEANDERARFDEMFPTEQLPRFAMLADVLLSADLRTLCMREILRRWDKLSDHPHLGSQMLRANTLRELAAQLSDTQVFRAKKRAKTNSLAASQGNEAPAGIPFAILEEDVEKRRQTRIDELRAMTDEELRILADMPMAVAKSVSRAETMASAATGMDPLEFSAGEASMSFSPPRGGGGTADGVGTSPGGDTSGGDLIATLKKGEQPDAAYLPWRDEVNLVLAERQRRESSSTNVALLRIPKNSAPFADLDKKRKTMEVHTSFRYVSVEGCGGVRCGLSTRKLYYECRIATCDRKHPPSIFIGFQLLSKSLVAPHLTASNNSGAAAKAAVRAGAVVGRSNEEPVVGFIPPVALNNEATGTTANGAAAPWGIQQQPIVGVTPAVAPPGSDVQGEYYGACMGDDGVVYCNGTPYEGMLGFGSGDVVGVCLDTFTGAVTFYRNGGAIPLPPGLPAITVPTHVGAVVPSATVYATTPAFQDQPTGAGTAAKPTDIVRARLEFCFDGGFRHQVPQGYQGFARGATPALSL